MRAGIRLDSHYSACDNGGEKSDPALREQPGSWPNSLRKSDMTQRTRTMPSVTRPEARA